MLARPLLLLAIALPAFAQTKPATRTSTGIARAMWESARDNVTRSATQVPEALYAYKPTPDVRTFGELISHVASSQNYYCAVALGEKPPAGGDSGANTKGKTDIVRALTESNAKCAQAYAQTDQASAAIATGEKESRLYQLFENAMHDNEHYGNIVTYMRLNHMVPPSSAPAPAKP